MVVTFDKKKFSECGSKIKDEWKFCPECGSSTDERMRKMRKAMPAGAQTIDLGGMFQEIEKEFGNIDKMFSQEKLRIKQFPIKGNNASGISITIQTGTGQQPRMQVKTIGDMKRMEPDIRKNLGYNPNLRVVDESPRKQRVVENTEEPDTEVKRTGNKQIIAIKLPDVKDIKDIEIRRLEQSIEIRAFAKNKMYFKLLPVSGNRVSRSFDNGVLKIEIS